MLVKIKTIFCRGKTVTVSNMIQLQSWVVFDSVMCLGPKREFRLHSGFILTLGNYKVGTINFYILSRILPRSLPELLSVG